MRLRWLLGLAVVLALGGPAGADELRIAMKGVVDGTDPHQSYSPNRNVQLHVYETLLLQDEHLQPIPGLAESVEPDRPADLGVHPAAGGAVP